MMERDQESSLWTRRTHVHFLHGRLLCERQDGRVRARFHAIAECARSEFETRWVESYFTQFHNSGSVRRALDRQTSPVIVDNTNIYVAHMMNYARLVSLKVAVRVLYDDRKFQAVEAGYEVYTITPTTAWKNKVGECSRFVE